MNALECVCVFSAGQSAMSQKQSEVGRARIMGNETKLNMNNLCSQWSQQKFRYSSVPERFTRDKLKKDFTIFFL